MKYKKIEDIRHGFKQEWLLVAVGEVDQSTGTPLTAALIAHAKTPEVLWEEAGTHPEPVMVLFSDDWPEDVAAAFFLHS